MKNIKTTAIGGLTIVVALGGAVLTYLKTGTLPDFQVLYATVTAGLIGLGLIHAADATNSK